MATGSTSCFTNDPQAGQGPHMYGDAHHHQDVLSTRIESGTGLDSPSTSLLYNLSLLKDKLHQVQSLVGMYISPNHSQNTDQSTAIAKANMGSLLQEIIITASSMLFSCQQISFGATPSKTSITHEESLIDKLPYDGLSQPNHGETTIDWFGENYSNTTCYTSMNNSEVSPILVDNSKKLSTMNNYDIIEMDAADLLAKYTHYCHICGKGFKRDANLRMHMRAHGDEYKSSAALSNPTKVNGGGYGNGNELARKYSCPQEGCRWNRKHAKFQPLKSMICVKNHYKRCHCPKMYVCKRCNRKQFSVLSDLRTHEKHCGDLKWQCSCGTTFSRKDKLMGHVANLFVGHFPAVNSFTTMSRNVKIGLDDR